MDNTRIHWLLNCVMTDSELPWDYPSPFILPLCVDAEHIDGLGHVNNAVYVRWCQDVGWKHSQNLGLDLTAYNELDAAMVIRHAEYDYAGSAYLAERCVIGTWLTGNDGRLAMERRFQLVRVNDGKTLLRARWQVVCIRMSNGRPRRMPNAFLERYGGAVIDAP